MGRETRFSIAFAAVAALVLACLVAYSSNLAYGVLALAGLFACFVISGLLEYRFLAKSEPRD